jgi:tetratricopeptide (TPR) repeat protein
MLLLALISLGTIYLGWAGFEKGASAFYFKKAVDLSNVEGASLDEMETLVNKALSHAPADTHYIALSRINFSKAQTAANATTGTPEENQAAFEESLRRSIEAARSAVSVNSASYQNWVSLGIIYSALVPAPLSLAGAYENASFAYSEAGKKNPLNPEIPLFLAQLELNNGDRKAALSSVRKAITLKEDYADAHLMLAQLEIQEGNTLGAIKLAERLAVLVPNNPGIYFELGVLKYSNKDYVGARDTFSQALSLAPDYANAQYYLGITFARLKQLDKALEQFEALSLTNPDNPEVQKILLDLRAGKDAFLKNSVI